ncbi:MAG: histidine kinase [Actinomycetia bacterium]|nr:histidine kinase [Actinomycetes bacterium]
MQIGLRSAPGALSARRGSGLPGKLAALRKSTAGHSVVIDACFAAALLAFAAEHLLREHPHPFVLVWALQIGLFLPLVWRRRAPFPVFTLVAGVAFAQWLTGVLLPAGDFALLIALYTVAAQEPLRRMLQAAGVLEAGVALATGQWAPPGDQIKMFVLLSGMTTAASVIGLNVRTRRAYLASLEDRAARLERERDQQAQIAVAAERARIAREMHDIVTHSLSVMVALADGASYAIPASPEQAADAIGKASHVGRQALGEMQRLLGVLRGDAEGRGETAYEAADDPAGDLGAGRHPQPGLGQLDDLLAQVRAAGLPTEFVVEGEPPPLQPGAQLAIYRVVQEALTNTRKHGGPGTTARVHLRYDVRAIKVEITDDGHGRSGPQMDGHGITGMRERAALYGGEVQAGPLPTTGWRVSARFLPARLEGST